MATKEPLSTPINNQDMENATQLDISNCDKEPIHIPGHIQSHGFLLALNPVTLDIERVSANVTDFTGKKPTEIIGRHVGVLQDVVLTRAGSTLTELLQLGKMTGNFEQLNPQKITVQDKEMFLIIHQHKDALICECEPSQTADENITLQKIMSTALAVIQSSGTLSKLLRRVAELVKEITGYDRVMIYKFHEDDHGEVVAEARNEDLESWLHLHYPASDIPAQARELYKLNLVRIIAAVNSQPSGLLSADKITTPLDLTHSVLRAVSPVHIEYLVNMKVGASFSISLLYKKRLWGLIACHSNSPRFIEYNSRIACKFIGQLFSAAMEFKSNENAEQEITLRRENQLSLFEQLMKEMEPVSALTQGPVTMMDINNSTGAVFCFEDKLYTIGKVPTDEQLRELMKWLRKNEASSFFQTSTLPIQYPGARAFADVASGLMITPLSLDLSEYIMWFKPEKIITVDWAGQQQKDNTVQNDGSLHLNPRKSFEKWSEEVKYISEEWADFEISGAIKLREDLIQVINKKANEIRKLNELLKEAYDELDTFSFTISHDLRTPLSSVKNYTEIILEDYGHEMNDDAKSLFQKVIKGTDKMAVLIKNVLQYSRVGRTELALEPINMQKLLPEIREEILAPHRGKNIEFELKNMPELHGDRTMIMQLFTNLAGNAVKYSTQSPVQKIEIDGKVKDGFVTYTIKDNGIGIDMKYADRIFELFKRLDNARDFEGTGVGLAIAKRIVEKHNGKIWLESRPNDGTKFYISIPEKKQDHA